MAKDTFYFSHDYNSIQDPKMMDLLSSCGLTGIGMYWIIIEILHQQETGTITLDQFKKYIKFYTAFQTGGQHVLERLEQELIKSNLLVEKDGIVYSERVLSNKKIREEISQKRSLAGIKSAESKGFKTSVEQNPTSVEQNQTKERKGKEIKEIKEKKNKEIDLSFLQKDFIPIVEKWLFYKKEKKQEYKGQTSINTFCKKLIEYSNGDAIIAEAIIEQSIANNWAGIFELKNNNNGNKQQNGLDADAKWRAEMQASIARDYAALHE